MIMIILAASALFAAPQTQDVRLPTFRAQTGVPYSPASIIATDLDHDGIPDFWIAGSDGASITAIGTGDGSFRSIRAVPVSVKADAIVTGDFDGDGNIDACLATSVSSAAAVVLGDGAGGTKTILPMTMPTFVWNLAVGDANGDGFLDLAAAESSGPPGFTSGTSFSYLPGTGSGAFGAPIKNVTGDFTSGLAFDDVDADGRDEIISTQTHNATAPTFALVVHKLLPSLSFAVIFNSTLSGSPASLTLRDIDGDGIRDAAVGFATIPNASTSSAAGVLKGFVGGYFAATPIPAPPSSGGFVNGTVQLDDLNGDGNIDLAVGSFSGSRLWAHVWVGNGTTTGFTFSETVAFPSGEIRARVHDLNGDGKADLFAANPWVNHITVLLASPAGAHALPNPTIPTVSSPAGVATADFNRDGKLDFIVGSDVVGGGLQAHAGDGAGGVTATAQYYDTAHTACPSIMYIIDFDEDGADDVLAMDYKSSPFNVHRFRNNGSGSLVYAGALSQGTTPPVPGFADVNGDGHLDMVGRIGFSGSISIAVSLGDGLGGFAAAQTVYGPDSKLLFVGTADVTGDGIVDAVALASSSAGQRSMLTLAGTAGAGWFTAPTVYSNISIINDAQRFIVGDANGDGIDDLALEYFDASTNSGSIQTLLSTGASFTTQTSHIPGSTLVYADKLIDLNGDGLGDLAGFEAGSPGKPPIYIYACEGNGLFSFAASYLNAGASSGGPTATAAIQDLEFADVDGDGRFDWVSSQRPSGNPQSGLLEIELNHTARAPSTVRYGASTPGCNGKLGLDVASDPGIGNAHFGFVATQAPPHFTGLLLIGTALDLSGNDVFGLDVTLYLDLFASTELYALDMKSDAHGQAHIETPLPNAPSLVGSLYCAQTLFFWPGACKPTAYGLSSTNAVALVVLP